MDKVKIPITRQVIVDLCRDVKKKKKAAEVRLKNVKDRETKLMSSMKELGYYEEEDE